VARVSESVLLFRVTNFTLFIVSLVAIRPNS
jgi:hypothetical protein